MVQNLEGEEWRDVGIVKGIDFTGYYQVSNKERVKRLKRTVIRSNGCCQNLQERLMNPKEDKYGYMRVCLTKDGIEKPMFLHRLVALAFVPNPDRPYGSLCGSLGSSPDSRFCCTLEIWL